MELREGGAVEMSKMFACQAVSRGDAKGEYAALDYEDVEREPRPHFSEKSAIFGVNDLAPKQWGGCSHRLSYTVVWGSCSCSRGSVDASDRPPQSNRHRPAPEGSREGPGLTMFWLCFLLLCFVLFLVRLTPQLDFGRLLSRALADCGALLRAGNGHGCTRTVYKSALSLV